MRFYFFTIKDHINEIILSNISVILVKVPLAILWGMINYFIGDNHTTVGALIVLILIDFITALIAKYKIGEKIESRKALKTATKLTVYALFVSGAHLTEKIVLGSTFIDEVVISFLALTELISIIENIGLMGYVVPKKLLNQIKNLRDSK